jgi:uncharacterized protein YjiS (DUF1127 family)
MQSKIRLPDQLIPTRRDADSPFGPAMTIGTDSTTSGELGTRVDRKIYLDPGLQPRRPADSGQGTSEARTHRTQSEPYPWWYSIPAAMSWLLNELIEGFAACGLAMYPGFFDLGPDRLDGREPVEAPQWSEPVQHQSRAEAAYREFGGWASEPGPLGPLTQAHLAADVSTFGSPIRSAAAKLVDYSGLRLPKTTSRHCHAPSASAAAAWWSKMGRKRRTRLMIRGLEDMDDRTLRDIGMSPGEIEALARQREYGK